MSYVVLARKWRPQSFEDLVGQEHVTTTLANAIAVGRVAHAFLFTGVRGVGKTTSARILAKALNCEKGPTATPCQTCPQCTEITVGSDVDVQEIDGASYNGVDEVRRLQESLPYRPQRDRFKIFIVDEVHMLSSAAWNAFLKTLEEPPPHVKFVFATTEVHKVPVTILSRCQRYDFKLIAAQTIAARLKHVLAAENIAADDAAVAIVSREAAGSMRDAMSLLDQVIAWMGSGDRLTAEGVSRVLGVAARSVLHRIGEALVAGDAATCVQTVGDLAQQGYDLPHVARDLLAHLRDLVVAKVCADPKELLDLADEEVRDVKSLAERADADDLARLQLGFSRCFDDIVRGGQPRAALEMALVRLARRPPLLPVDELLRRVADLERRLEGGGGGGGTGGGGRGTGPGGPPGGGRGQPPPRGMGASSQPGESSSSKAPPTRPSFDPAPPGPARSASDTASPSAPARPSFEGPSSSNGPPARPSFEPPPTAAAPARPSFESPSSGHSARPGLEAPGNGAPARPSFEVPPATGGSAPPSRGRADAAFGAASTPSSTNRGAAAAPDPPKMTLPEADVAGWRALLELVRARRPALASVLEHAGLVAFGPGGIKLAYEPSSFLAVHATDATARELLAGAVRNHFGAAAEVTIDTAAPRGICTIAQLDAAERRVRMESARRAVVEHPLVSAAIEVLGAELRDVRLGQEFADA